MPGPLLLLLVCIAAVVSRAACSVHSAVVQQWIMGGVCLCACLIEYAKTTKNPFELKGEFTERCQKKATFCCERDAA